MSSVRLLTSADLLEVVSFAAACTLLAFRWALAILGLVRQRNSGIRMLLARFPIGMDSLLVLEDCDGGCSLSTCWSGVG